MNERRWWIGIVAGGVLAAAGLSTLIWMKHGDIDTARAGIQSVRSQSESARKLIEGTATLEREVIVLRELAEVMKGILPDSNDAANLVRTLETFTADAGVRTSGLKQKNVNESAAKKGKLDFKKLAYTVQLEADTFQFLDLMDMIEGHSRFMRVPAFRVQAAARREMEKEGVAAHKVSLDIETYVYEPEKGEKQVRIDGYERKRDLLLGEINRRKQGLVLSSYSYRGQRGRRDPLIDPRVPVQPEAASTLTVQQQMDLVEALAQRTVGVLAKFEESKRAENVIVEMVTRSEMEEELTALEGEVRRVVEDRSIVYVPSGRRLQDEVVDPLNRLRDQLTSTEAGRGPSEAQLREVENAMLTHREAAEFTQMLEAFAAVDNRLRLAEADPVRKLVVDRLRDLAYEARTVLDFQGVELRVGGLAIAAGAPPVAMINGKAVGEGDTLSEDLIVHQIRGDEIEFIFRGVVFARRL